jgi:hypothetical protein
MAVKAIKNLGHLSGDPALLTEQWHAGAGNREPRFKKNLGHPFFG